MCIPTLLRLVLEALPSDQADVALDTHTQVGVEECRREEALHAASWLVFWAKGPSQAHEWFGGDELAVRLSIYVTRDRAAFRSQLPLLAGACCGQCP